MSAFTVLITGASGFVGGALASSLLRDGHRVIGLTRDKHTASRKLDGANIRWVQSLDELDSQTHIDCIVNLAGESLAAKRWSAKQKKVIWDSRLHTTESVVALIERLNAKPKLLLNASAVGYYGPHAAETLTEQAVSVDSFSYRLCEAWEQMARSAQAHTQVTCCRLGVVLGQSGALVELVRSFEFGTKTIMGSGQQYFSWIHLHDVVAAFSGLIKSQLVAHPPDSIFPTYNFTSPNPVTYRQLAEAIDKHYRTFLTMRLPAFLLKPLVGEMAEELLLTGQRVVPSHLRAEGFQFRYPTLETAFKELLPL